jgi:hypothetical protein
MVDSTFDIGPDSALESVRYQAGRNSRSGTATGLETLKHLWNWALDKVTDARELHTTVHLHSENIFKGASEVLSCDEDGDDPRA